MWGAIQRYVRKRRRGFVQSAVFLCGTYVVSAYVNDRLEEANDRMRRNKLARDNLRRRFQSIHDDVCFTIMALIPTLASQVLEDMDVEALTNELQSLSRASRSRTLHPSQNQQRSQSVSSVSDVHSDPGAASFSSYSGSVFDGDRTSATSGSWVEPASASQSPASRPDISTQLSDSVVSTTSSPSNNLEGSASSAGSRTKVQLWNEVKILALTRTLTTLYTVALLSLLTAVQLNLLGRCRYIDSVRTAERAERARDDVPHLSATEVLVRETAGKLVDVEAIWHAWTIGEDEDEDEDEELDRIPEETEMRFLTLSWWVLHVGWKDVAARVRSSVESVFDDVSLKAKLSASELFALIADVRRRVEMDGTGSKLGERFMSSLLPPTPETIAHVLAQGGALSIPRENETCGIDRSRVASPPHGGIRSSTSRPKTARDGSSRATAIPIESPIPQPAAFPTPPSSHAHDSDLSSRASQSPSSSSAPRHPPAHPAGTFDSLATSRSTLDIDPRFNTLLAQTRRYLSGPDFAHALLCALDRATEVLMDGLRARVFVDSSSAVNLPPTEEAPSMNVDHEQKDEVKIRLAGLLPGLTRWCQLALNAMPNELVDNIMAVKEVNALEAIIISDYADRFPAIS